VLCLSMALVRRFPAQVALRTLAEMPVVLVEVPPGQCRRAEPALEPPRVLKAPVALRESVRRQVRAAREQLLGPRD
jgi:hypothetical protein